MNRILQKFVGDASSSASSSASLQRQTSNGRTPASTGNMSSGGANWVSASYHGQTQAQSYQYATQSQQQQYYGQQQQPVSDGGGYGYHSQQEYGHYQQQGYVATNSQGQYLDEIPLSSPPANAKPDAATLFSDAHYPQQQQQSYYGYDGYNVQQQQQLPAVADSLFQISHSVTSSGSAPPRSASGSPDPFAQPPRSSSSSRSGSGFGHFQESAPNDPFAMSGASLSFTTSASSTSLNAFEQQQSPFHAQQQQEPVASLSRSTPGSASDLFANPPPSTTPSYDGFDQQQQSAFGNESHDNTATLTTSRSAADLFASAAPGTPGFYDGFAQQSDNSGWDSAAAPSEAPASADLFASAAPVEVSSPSPFDSFAQHHHQAHDYYATSSESASPFGESSTASVDPFANPLESTASSSHSNGFSQQNDSVGVDNIDPFASSSQSFANSNNSFEQHFEQPQQQHQYYASNQELGPFGNSTGATSSEYDQADPFAEMQPEPEYANHYQSEPVDPFAQQPTVSTGFGYHVQDQSATADAAPPVSLSPTQVNDFFSDAPPSAISLFSSQSTESVAKSPRPPLSPKKSATTALEPNGLGFSPRKPAFSDHEPTAIPAAPTAFTTTTITKKEQEPTDPVAAAAAAEDEAEALALQLKKTTLDDSHKLVEMYKHMAERLEGEKNELLKVLADQADQFYQMQEYIASLEQELAAHRSNGGK
ncbi:Presenilin-like protein [Globisporangium polare]